jgi:hypothetical protein
LQIFRAASFQECRIVADWAWRGKRKVCEGQRERSHAVHSFSTSTRFVQSAKFF